MRKIMTGLLAAALVLGLAAAQPAQAKVYKMAPEERAAALKEKKAQGKKSKKAGKPAPGHDQGGWVEVKPGEKIAKKNRKSKVDELAKAAESKGKKSKKGKKDAAQAPEKASPAKAGKDRKPKAEEGAAQKKDARPGRPDKKAEKAEKAGKTDKAAARKTGRKDASHGDRLVGRDFTGERKVSASSTEVRRPAPSTPQVQAAPAHAPAPAVVPSPAAPAQAPAPAPAQVPAPAPKKADEPGGFSVSRPAQEKVTLRPEVRQEVQPGPVDAAKPVGTERKAGEGRF